MRDDFRCRDEGNLDIVKAGDFGPVIAGATALHELQSGARKERGRILLQTALGGDSENERGGRHVAHRHQSVWPALRHCKRSIQIAAPTAPTSP